MADIILTFQRFSTFIRAREAFRAAPCIYLQTDPEENLLRVGECDDLCKRYKGGTAYALDAAGHGAGNLFFVAAAPQERAERCALEATLVYDLQPPYNNQHKKRPPRRRVPYVLSGDVPRGCLRS